MSGLRVTTIPARVAVSALEPGDILDLAGDTYADPAGDNVAFEFEYATVAAVEVETPACIRVDIEGGPSIGFPPGHIVARYGHDSGYDENNNNGGATKTA